MKRQRTVVLYICNLLSDRICKYNQLLRIQEELGQSAEFLGIESLNFQ